MPNIVAGIVPIALPGVRGGRGVRLAGGAGARACATPEAVGQTANGSIRGHRRNVRRREGT